MCSEDPTLPRAGAMGLEVSSSQHYQLHDTRSSRTRWCWEQAGQAAGGKPGAQGAQGKVEEHTRL